MKVLEAPETGAARVAASNADAELFALEREMEAIQKQIDDIHAEQSAAWRRFEANQPSKPEALRIQPEDERLLGHRPHGDDNGFHDFAPVYVADLETKQFCQTQATYVSTDTWEPIAKENLHGEMFVDYTMVFTKAPDPRAQARATELATAWRAWEAECKTVQRAVGYDKQRELEDEELTDPLYSEKWAVGERIFATRATTLAGMLVKLRAYDQLDMKYNEDNPAFPSLAADINALAAAA